MDTFYCHDIVDSTLINAFCNRLHRLGLCLEELQFLLFDIDNSHHVFELQFWLLDCQRTFVHDVVAVISKINVKSYNHQTFPGQFQAHLNGLVSGPRFEIKLILNLDLNASVSPPGNLIQPNIFALIEHFGKFFLNAMPITV